MFCLFFGGGLLFFSYKSSVIAYKGKNIKIDVLVKTLYIVYNVGTIVSVNITNSCILQIISNYTGTVNACEPICLNH